MRKPEQAMWDALRPLLAPVDPYRVENHIIPGMPDVNYVDGWLELKYLAEWPKKADTIVRLEHFTSQQRVWIMKRAEAGGLVFVILKVGQREWLLFDGRVAVRLLGNVIRERLYKVCRARWERKPTSEEILLWIRKTYA